MDLTTIFQAVITGVLMAGIYALVAIGLTLIFGVVRIVNFAQGEFVMLGMYVTWWLWKAGGIDPYLSLLITMPVLFVFGVLVQRFLFRPILSAPDMAQIFLTVGLSVVLMNAALFFFTADFRSVKTTYSEWALRVAGITLSVPRIFAFAGALVLAGLLTLFLSKTDIGKALRAVAQDREVSMLLGIDPERMYLLAVGLGAALAGAAGGLIVPFFYVFPTVGVVFVLIAFVVVILGTLGSIQGALLASLIVGVAESLGILFAGADLGLVVVFAILVATLILKPSGLMGQA
ncbi:MAG: branched-chain amino acid ABC transporter permease [candidate division NC10 bacterium]|nr:branched-chain amino acid ABC transporter permease [candidate division NC10 bacterium]MBI2113996.1 branched-chain amino acid ABC transporter permease [candidate division NC10 bacterium]MBI2455299.1 branched-chain amino acid ABC transporter permease [candidate division NC10 bacterium]MBI3087011.1 branched-chain amino acid ABC transporter permease [candidate division NC10 bacterium]